MAENSGISWTTHTFNPWIGCQKVSPGCDNCYAEGWANRYGQVQWGPGAERRLTSDGNWHKPVLWDKRAGEHGVRERVFCASLADVFDNAVPGEWRERLWRLINDTENLDWMLLTKRPQNIEWMMPIWGFDWPDIWLGATTENQVEFDRRAPFLCDVAAGVRFLSVEPMLGQVDISAYADSIDLVICGGESGPNRRPMDWDWTRHLRDQCADAGIAFFLKQGNAHRAGQDDVLDGLTHKALPVVGIHG